MHGIPDLGATELQRLDELCNRYEAEWMSGNTPRIEDFLGDATEPFRSVLLSELLRLEFHYRADCTLEELQKRFPEVAATVLVDAAHEAKANVPAAGRLPGIPGYQILGVLGRGGMGIVYEALDLELDRRVALKMLHATHHAPSFRTRFAGEARSAARMHHPHLVQIFDVGEANGQPFLVFELMEGGTLSQRLAGQPLATREAARLLEPLARAVQLAHENGVVHRDLKPSNVLMTKDHQSAKISDFGLAKRPDDDSNQTQSGMMMGTPAYMAPEQADPSRSGVGPASDIYSLGAILYEMLTGQPPFRAASLIETLEQLRTRDPVPPRAINPKIPRDLETICLKCLQKEPHRRYTSADLLADELGRFQRSEPILARPVGWVEQTRRFCHRHPATASLAAILALVLATGFSVVFSLWRDAEEQRQLAEKNAGLQLLQRDQAVKDRDRAEALQKQAERERERAELETARAERERERAEDNAKEAARQTAAAAAHLKAAESRFAQAQSAVAELFQLGNHLLRVPNMEARGKSALDRAMQFKQSLLAEKSDDPGVQFGTAQAVLQMAWAQLELGLHEESEQSYRSAIDLFQQVRASQGDTLDVLRELRGAHVFLGVALSNQAKWREAEVIARESARLARQVIENPSHVTFDKLVLGNALMNLSQSLLANGLADEARSALEEAVRIQREVRVTFPDKNQAAAELSLALGGLAGHVAKTDRAAALDLANEALQLRRSQIEATSNPRDEAMYFARVSLQVASLYSDLKRPDDALRVLEEALRHAEPASIKYPAYRGLRITHVYCLSQMQSIELGRKNQPEADQLQRELEVQLRRILEVLPGDVEARSRLGAILVAESRRLAALRDYDAAWDRAMEGMNLFRDLHVEAEPALTWVRQLRNSVIRVLATPPRFEREKEKLQVARDFVRLVPNDATACNSLAWHLLLARDPAVLNPAEGLKMAQRAVELDSATPFFLNTLGLGYLLNGDLDAAQAAFEKSLELKTRVPAADWYYLAIIHWRKGDETTARAQFDKAAESRLAKSPLDEELLDIERTARRELGLPLEPMETGDRTGKPDEMGTPTDVDCRADPMDSNTEEHISMAPHDPGNTVQQP